MIYSQGEGPKTDKKLVDMKYFQKKTVFLLVALISSVIVISLSISKANSQDDSHDWKADWEIEEGFAISIDTQGY